MVQQAEAGSWVDRARWGQHGLQQAGGPQAVAAAVYGVGQALVDAAHGAPQVADQFAAGTSFTGGVQDQGLGAQHDDAVGEFNAEAFDGIQGGAVGAGRGGQALTCVALTSWTAGQEVDAGADGQGQGQEAAQAQFFGQHPGALDLRARVGASGLCQQDAEENPSQGLAAAIVQAARQDQGFPQAVFGGLHLVRVQEQGALAGQAFDLQADLAGCAGRAQGSAGGGQGPQAATGLAPGSSP